MKRKGLLMLALAFLLICLTTGCSGNPGDVSATATPASGGGVLEDMPLLPTQAPTPNVTEPAQTTPAGTTPVQTSPAQTSPADGLLGTQTPGGVTER